MSREADHPEPPNPIRPGMEPSTWRPAGPGPQPSAKAGPGGTGGARASRARGDRDPEPVRGGPSWTERLVFGSVGAGNLALFCRQFAAYLNAGVDLVRALASLEKQFARTALGPVLGRLQVAVRRGEALADAMAREPQAFDGFFLSMMRVAEARGGVPETLRMLSRHYEARQRLFRQARSAMIYPVAVLIVAALVVALLTMVILPIMIEGLRDMAGRGAALPGPTRMLMAYSTFMQTLGWWLVPLVLVGLIFGLWRAYQTAAGKRVIDEVMLAMPVLGKLLRLIDTTRFARTLSALLEGGVDMKASLDLTADTLRLSPFRRAVRRARDSVVQGIELSDSLDASRRFSHDVIAIIQSGEETGKLPESLERLADDYEDRVAHMVKNLGHLIQPIITIGLGGLVLFVALAFFLAYLSLLAGAGLR